MRYVLVLAFKLAVLLMLISCTTQQPSASSTIDRVVPTPVNGQAVASGRVLSVITGKPIYRVRVAFAEVIRGEGNDAIYVDDGGLTTPSAETDQDGYFIIPALPPKEYVIVVGDPLGPNDVVRNPDTKLPRIWKIEPNQQLDLGEIKVNIGV